MRSTNSSVGSEVFLTDPNLHDQLDVLVHACLASQSRPNLMLRVSELKDNGQFVGTAELSVNGVAKTFLRICDAFLHVPRDVR